jgi:hypothetical protein
MGFEAETVSAARRRRHPPSLDLFRTGWLSRLFPAPSRTQSITRYVGTDPGDRRVSGEIYQRSNPRYSVAADVSAERRMVPNSLVTEEGLQIGDFRTQWQAAEFANCAVAKMRDKSVAN